MIQFLHSVKMFSVVLIGSITLTSCASMLAGKTTPAVLVDCPADLVVTSNGNKLPVVQVKSSVSGNADNSTTTYYASGVELDKKIKRHVLTLESGGKTKTVEVKLGAGGNWIVLDLFVGGPIAWIIDGVTKKWRVAKNKYIDVSAIMDGKDPRGQGKLKRTIKRQAKGKA